MNLDAHRIAPKLYQGANPPKGPALKSLGFDTLVLCAMEHQDPASDYPGLKVIHAPMDDNAWVPRETAMRAAREVACEIKAGRRVLVVCHQGRNRSGLVSALALWFMGKSGVEALWQVQTARPDSLSNQFFARFLFFLPPRYARRRARAAA
jgi:protein-tyrosine phosphatase